MMPIRFRLFGVIASVVSLAGAGLRLGLVMDRRGTQALKQCASQAGFSATAATKAARCVGTVVVAIWSRQSGQLVPVGTVGRMPAKKTTP